MGVTFCKREEAGQGIKRYIFAWGEGFIGGLVQRSDSALHFKAALKRW